jgi:hypothetical protein
MPLVSRVFMGARRGLVLVVFGLGVAHAAPSAQATDGALPAWGAWRLGAYGHVTGQAWSNGLPIIEMDGRWQQGYQQRQAVQRAYQTLDAEVGVSVAMAPDPASAPAVWRIGWVQRAQAQVRLSGQAAQVVYHYQSQTDPAQAQSLDSAATVQYWQGQGLSVHSPAWRLGAWQVSGRVQWLQLQRLRRTDTSGTTAYDGAGAYAYRMDLRDADSRRQAAFLAPAEAYGQGASMSLAVQWQPASGVVAGLALDDAWSQLQWRGVNATRAVLNSEVSNRTPEGYIDYQPAVKGQDTRRTVSERIPVTVRADLIWQRPEGDWFVQLQHRWGLQQTWLGWAGGQAWRWRVALEPQARAASVGVQWQGWCLQAAADRLDGGAHVRQLALAYQWGAQGCGVAR